MDGPVFEHRWGQVMFSISAYIGPGAQQDSSTMGTGLLSWGQSGWGVTSNTHLHLAPSAGVKCEWSHTTTPPPRYRYFTLRGCL
jgi:hypothetical protein